jgi:hypothetical protein
MLTISAEMNKLLLLRLRIQDLMRQVEGVHAVMEALHAEAHEDHAIRDRSAAAAAAAASNSNKGGQCGPLDGGEGGGVGGDKEDSETLGSLEVAWLLEEHMGEIGVLRSYLKSLLEELEDMRKLLQFQVCGRVC